MEYGIDKCQTTRNANIANLTIDYETLLDNKDNKINSLKAEICHLKIKIDKMQKELDGYEDNLVYPAKFE